MIDKPIYAKQMECIIGVGECFTITFATSQTTIPIVTKIMKTQLRLQHVITMEEGGDEALFPGQHRPRSQSVSSPPPEARPVPLLRPYCGCTP